MKTIEIKGLKLVVPDSASVSVEGDTVTIGGRESHVHYHYHYAPSNFLGGYVGGGYQTYSPLTLYAQGPPTQYATQGLLGAGTATSSK